MAKILTDWVSHSSSFQSPQTCLHRRFYTRKKCLAQDKVRCEKFNVIVLNGDPTCRIVQGIFSWKMEGPNKEAFEKWANPYFYECKLCRDKKLRHHDNHQQHLRKVHKTTVKDHCDMFDIKRLMHKCLVCKEERKDNEYVHCKRHLVKHFASMHYPQIRCERWHVLGDFFLLMKGPLLLKELRIGHNCIKPVIPIALNRSECERGLVWKTSVSDHTCCKLASTNILCNTSLTHWTTLLNQNDSSVK